MWDSVYIFSVLCFYLFGPPVSVVRPLSLKDLVNLIPGCQSDPWFVFVSLCFSQIQFSRVIQSQVCIVHFLFTQIIYYFDVQSVAQIDRDDPNGYTVLSNPLFVLYFLIIRF